MERLIQLTGADELRRSWGWFLGLGDCADHPRRDRDRLGVLDDHRVGMVLRLASHYRRSHGSRACLLAQTLGRFFLDLLTGVLYVVVGWMMVNNPQESALLLTLIIAMFLVFEGVLRIVTAITVRYPHWGSVLFNGVISLFTGYSYLAAMASFRSLGNRSFRRHRNAAQRLVACQAEHDRPQASGGSIGG